MDLEGTVRNGALTPPPPPWPAKVPRSRWYLFAPLFRKFVDPLLKKLQYYTDPHKIILAAAVKQVTIFPPNIYIITSLVL